MRYLRPEEAAKYLGIGLSTVWLYVKQGKLKTYKLSQRVTVLRQSEIEEYVNACAMAA